MKKIGLLIIFTLLLFLAWYLLLKPDYKAKFTVKTNVGTLNQTIKSWNRLYNKDFPVKQESENILAQRFLFNDSIHGYKWNLKKKNDSITDVTIYIDDTSSDIIGRIQNMFTYTKFEKRSKSNILKIYDFIKTHLENIEIQINGISNLATQSYAYTEFNGLQNNKVRGMMRDIGFLENNLIQSNIELEGPPFITITHWDRVNDSIQYQFGFPIKFSDSFPNITGIKYKTRPKQKALKATYYGNYISSDRAWYALLNYAKTHGLEVVPLPTEVFYNNPNIGGDETQWKAEVYLPIK